MPGDVQPTHKEREICPCTPCGWPKCPCPDEPYKPIVTVEALVADHPRVIMVEGVPWVSHEFHQRMLAELREAIRGVGSAWRGGEDAEIATAIQAATDAAGLSEQEGG